MVTDLHINYHLYLNNIITAITSLLLHSPISQSILPNLLSHITNEHSRKGQQGLRITDGHHKGVEAMTLPVWSVQLCKDD